jgi:hypothetical protein
VAYKLDLSSASLLKDIHPVFHVSLLREFRESQQFPRAAPKADVIDGEVHHHVKCFSDYRITAIRSTLWNSLMGRQVTGPLRLTSGLTCLKLPMH